jgi:hypothetical protein
MKIHPNISLIKKNRLTSGGGNFTFFRENTQLMPSDFNHLLSHSDNGVFMFLKPIPIEFNYTIANMYSKNLHFEYVLDNDPFISSTNENTVKEHWDINNEEENDYWNSFIE